MADSNYEYVISLVDKVSAKLDLIERALSKADSRVKRTQTSVLSLSGAFNSLGRFSLNLNEISNAFSRIQSVAVGFVRTTASVESLENTIKFASGTAGEGARNLEYLKNTSNQLGLNQKVLTEGFKGFSSSLMGSAFEGHQVRKMYEQVSIATSAMGVSADDSKGIFLALGQIMSKGTVSAEELRGQLGERLPNAFGIAAKAMGVTQKQLNKMLEQGQIASEKFLPLFANELQKTFEGALPKATQSLQANINRLENSFYNLQRSVGYALNDSFNAGIKVLNSGLGIISKVSDNFHILDAATLPLRAAFGSLFTAIGNLLDKLGLLKSTGDPVINTLNNIGLVFQVLTLPIEVALNLLTFVISHLDTLAQYAVALGVSIVGLASVFAILNPQLSLFIARMALMQAWTWAVTVATNAMAVVQGILNAIMNMNPIFLIITGLALFAAGLVYAYKQSETFRDIVDAAFNAILAPVQYAYQAIMRVVEAIKEVLRYVGLLSREGDKQLAKAVNIAKNKRLADQNAEAEKVGGMQSIADKGGLVGDLAAKGDLNAALSNASNLPKVGVGAGGVGSGASSALSGVSGGGAKQTNITIQQVKFTDAINLNSQTVREGAAELQAIFDEMFLRTINSAQQMAE